MLEGQQAWCLLESGRQQMAVSPATNTITAVPGSGTTILIEPEWTV